MNICFDVPAPPKGKVRHHTNHETRTMFPDAGQKVYETLVKTYFVKAALEQGWSKPPKGTPLQVYIFSMQKIPKSDSKKKKEAKERGELRPTQKPDIDNVIKSILDALNETAWFDDCDIVEIGAVKGFSEDPFVKVMISDEPNYSISTADHKFQLLRIDYEKKTL